jgi:hypothetical protein
MIMGESHATGKRHFNRRGYRPCSRWGRWITNAKSLLKPRRIQTTED